MIAWLEFELTFYDVAVQHMKHNATFDVENKMILLQSNIGICFI